MKRFIHRYDKHKRHYYGHDNIKKYRRRIRVMRPISIIISLLIIFSLISLLVTNKGYFILGFILTISLIKEVFAYINSNRLTKYILEPIEQLNQAVEEVAKGNYGFKVDAKNPENEIGGLISSFNKMSEKLKESEELQKKYEHNRKNLIATISHDLKTPMTSILGYSQGIKEGIVSSNEDINRYIDIIYQNALYTSNLINDLFLFSTLDIQKLEFNFINLNIKRFLDDLLTELMLEYSEKNIMITYFNSIDTNQELSIDGKRIRQVILNIINNAIKYNDKNLVKIVCKVKQIKNGVLIAISDNGPGINQEIANDVFEHFYRADESRNKDTGGLGLGLAISKEIVKAHNGDIWAENNKNFGVTLYFSIKSNS